MTDLKKMMTTSISKVLETMFFMTLEFDDYTTLEESNLLNSDNLRACRLDFKGSFSGHFEVFIPENILINMAVDFMGEEHANITREHSDGILKEVINMVAGNMFADLDKHVEFALGIPEMIPVNDFISGLNDGREKNLILAESIDGFLGFLLEKE